MTAGPLDPNVSIEHYRQMDRDAVNVENELNPDKQALNARYVSDFLNSRGITANNIDKNFTLATALELTSSQKKSTGAQKMAEVLQDTKSFLDQHELHDLFDDMNEDTTKSNIKFELDKIGQSAQQTRIERGFSTYRAVKMYCERMFKIREQFTNERDKEKTQTDKTVKEEFAGVMNDAKKNFEGMDGKEKIMLVVGGLIGAGMLLTSDSDRVGKVRETIWTCMKIAGLGWFGNTIFKVLTGKSVMTTVSDWTKDTVATDSFWTKTYKSTAEQAAILRKSTVYLGNKNFLQLANDYQHANANGLKKMSVPGVRSSDMSDSQIYTSMEVFFRRYPVEGLINKYQNANPPLTWEQVVGAEMIEDGSIDMPGSLVGRTADTVKSKATQLYNAATPRVKSAGNYVANADFETGARKVGEKSGKVVRGLVLGVAGGTGALAHGLYEGAKGTGKLVVEGGKEVASDVAEVGVAMWEYAKVLYRKTFHKDGSDEEILEWSQKSLKNLDEGMSGSLDKFVQQNLEKKKADGYVEAMRRGSNDRVGDVDIKFIERDTGTSTAAIYVAAGCTIPASDKGVTQNGILEAMKKADAGARDFFKKKHPELAGNIDTYVEFSQGVYVVNDHSYKVFMRMPVVGTPEFNQRQQGRWTPEEMKARKDLEIFGPENKFEYGQLKEEEQQKIRLNFFVDATQTAELNEICAAYTALYNTKGLLINVVRERLVNNMEDRDMVLKSLQTSIKLERHLFGNRGDLIGREDEINNIEEKVAAKLPGNTDTRRQAMEKMKKEKGYLVRLALLGDSEAMHEFDYDPKSHDKSRVTKPEQLLKIYQLKLEDAYKS